jgi:integrase
MKSMETLDVAKSGKEMAKTKASKLSAQYWLPKIYRPRYTGRDGSAGEVSLFWARISHAGRRHAVCLQTGEKRVAATKAAALFAAICGKGWDVALASIDPDKHAPRVGVTVADVITTLERLDLRDRTRANYVNCLRWWAARHLETRPGRKEFSRDSGAWRAKLGEVPLADLTLVRLEHIRDRFIATAGDDAMKQRRARISVKSYLRNAKAGIHAVEKLGRVALPSPRPFDGLLVTGATTTPYRSKIDAAELIRNAHRTLRNQDVGAYLAIILAMGSGLRRKEIKNLQWGSIDATSNRILVELGQSWQLRPKTTDSEAAVDVDAGLIAELEQYRGAPDANVVDALSIERAVEWLRAQGLDMNKPLHSLRAEFGSIICATSDLLTASRQLRHSSLAVTAAVYVESRRKTAPAIGSMLNPNPA